MTLSHTFRLSFYVSLGISCLSLFYAEWDFQPGISLMFPLVVTVMVFAYRREGEGYLNEVAANRLGSIIAGATLFWMFLKVPRSDADLVTGGVPWPAGLVPLLAPLLPTLLLVKLFRPKSLGDFWVFQTISLVIVTLSCILAGEIWFFLLMAIFMASQVWCLALYFQYRQGSLLKNPNLDPRQFPLFDKVLIRDPRPVPWPFLGMRRAMRWVVPVLGVGMGLFFVMPRFTDSQWVPNRLTSSGRVTMKSGSSSGMDLYREGTVEMSQETAFEVQAMNGDGSPAALPMNQHWRIQVLEYYEAGQWRGIFTSEVERGLVGHREFKKRPAPGAQHVALNEQSPDVPPAELKDPEVYLCFAVLPEKVGIKAELHRISGLPLADPITSPERIGLFPELKGQLADLPFFWYLPGRDRFVANNKMFNRNVIMRYGQTYAPGFRLMQVPVIQLNDRYREVLSRQAAPASIKKWTLELLKRLPGLAPADLVADGHGQYPAAKHAQLSRALCNHLAESGEFTYSLKLRRLVMAEDPTADFLLNLKEGHCERYASGLTLMLRSLHIPCRVVKGYSGCELSDKPGHYIVRQDHAHSWVEALVPGNTPDSWQWLQLDPTPSFDASSSSLMPFLHKVWGRISNPQVFWKSMIMDYNTERQNEAGEQFHDLWDSVTEPNRRATLLENIWSVVRWPLLLVGVLLGGFAATWGWRWWFVGAKGYAKGMPQLDFYARLTKVLSRYCHLQPQLGQTPLEFARQAGTAIAARSRTMPAELADLPVQAAYLLYRVRFSPQAPLPEERHALETQISRLEAALREDRSQGSGVRGQ